MSLLQTRSEVSLSYEPEEGVGSNNSQAVMKAKGGHKVLKSAGSTLIHAARGHMSHQQLHPSGKLQAKAKTPPPPSPRKSELKDTGEEAEALPMGRSPSQRQHGRFQRGKDRQHGTKEMNFGMDAPAARTMEHMGKAWAQSTKEFEHSKLGKDMAKGAKDMAQGVADFSKSMKKFQKKGFAAGRARSHGSRGDPAPAGNTNSVMKIYQDGLKQQQAAYKAFMKNATEWWQDVAKGYLGGVSNATKHYYKVLDRAGQAAKLFPNWAGGWLPNYYEDPYK